MASGKHEETLAAYQKSLAIRQQLAERDKGNAGWQTDLVIGLVKVSTVAEPVQARAALTQARAIDETLAREGKLTAGQQSWPQDLRERLAKLPPEQAEAR
ncbi:MAG: hypothetical protein ABWZ64_12370 [Xanthobacteraceae bacterium]